ncbi:MAG: anaerobic ribonucleoside-triphosphate reductase activating protein [Candidatus Marinimicrobia bacterium]|nr:anaerobic ribonucleoside-triphosphate reductase activating protein [Candidatus Neomarinimicrobiota bacterium]
MKIAALQKTSLIDYPGEIAAVLFTQGCNFRCPYCHNPELVDPGLFTTPKNIEEILKFLEIRKGLLDGVVITGGEPTLHQDLPELMQRIKNLGYKIKLDTNGTNPTMLRRVIDEALVDYIAMDYKAPLNKYSWVVRAEVNLNDIIESMELIKGSGISYEFRTTVVEQLLAPVDIEIIKAEIGSGEKYCIQKFNPTKTLDQDFMEYSTFSPQFFDQLDKARNQGAIKEQIIR